MIVLVAVTPFRVALICARSGASAVTWNSTLLCPVKTVTLDGAIVWLVTLPLLLALGALGLTGHWGGWYGGLASIAPLGPGAAPDPELAEVTRNNALATTVALLIGLVGGVIGGWMASGEPMTFGVGR